MTKTEIQVVGVSTAQKIQIKALAGGIGAGLSGILLYPFEQIKTRLQQAENTPDKETREKEKQQKDSFQKEFVVTFKKICAKHGVLSLYEGVVPMVCFQVASWGVFFGILETLKQLFTVQTASQIWIASFLSGLANAFLTSPLSVVSNHVINHNKNSPTSLSMLGAFKQIIRDNGIAGLYKGLMFSQILVINPTINMLVFEKFKIWLPLLMNPDIAIFQSGGLSKLVATLITYPLTTMKVNRQTQKGQSSSTLKMITQIYEKYGIAGYYSGLSAKVLHSVLNSALSLYLNEKINTQVQKLVSS